MPTSWLASFFQHPRTIWPWSQPTLTIGLDLDSQAMTFVDLREKQGRQYVNQWGCEKLDTNMVQDGRIHNKAALVLALTLFVEKYHLSGASVAMGVNGASVMVKRISVPRCHQHDLDDYVMWETSQYIPYDPEEVYLDFSPCSSSLLGETIEDLDILLIAAKREAVDERRDVLEAVGLHPVICDVEALAFLNWTSMHEVVQHHSTYLIANLRESMMNVAVMVQGEPLLVRDVNFSSVSIHNEARTVLNSLAQGAWRNGEQATIHHDPSPSEKMLWLEILSELKRTIEGAKEMLPDLEVEKVFLAGPLAERCGLQEELRQSFSIPVCRLGLTSPVKSHEVKIGSQPLSPLTHIAEGLALRAFHG